ncbi:MAG: Smr/MutS family protein [Salinivirgaceae bacterium]|nr:Smr/MutS family protein [Salinivirgaceae bacterium]
MIYPDNFEQKIDFVRVREAVKGCCLGEVGQWLTDKMRFMPKAADVQNRLAEVSEFMQLVQSQVEFPTDFFFDLRKLFAKMRIDGSFAETEELFNLYRSLSTVKAILRFFAKEENAERYPALSGLAANVAVHSFVTDSIEHIMTKQGRIRDNASPELARIRSEQAEKQGAASKLIRRIIAEAQQEGWVEADATLAVRDGRLVIPISASQKRRIAGIIHDESATGKTSYVEPAPVVELNNAISELEAAERREIVRILKSVTDSIRPYTDDLDDALMFLGIIDFIRAKARYALQIGATVPQLADEPLIDWQNARHPILQEAFREAGRTLVPLNISLNTTDRILVISGPNAGGKSVCLKTVGLLQYMLQCGLPLPVDQNSRVGIFSNIFIDIGDEQSIDNDLSTYSSHLLNMKHFVKNADNRTLILIDEFGTGTEPMLGGAIAEAILDKLNTAKVFGVITTHYTNLKHFAAGHDGIVNGAMLYDTNRMEPMFVMEAGKPGSSFAFEIAYKIGLPQDVIDDARSKVGENHLNFDKHLREIARDKYYWERKRENIRKIERRLEEMMETEKRELDETKRLRKELISKSKDDAKHIISESNKLIENAIRQIKESQADKQKTKEARQQIDDFKQATEQANDAEEERILQKIRKLKERENRVKSSKSKQQEQLKAADVVEERKLDFTIGMPVRIEGQTTVGEIMELNGKNAVVAFGSLYMNVEISKLQHLTDDEKRKIRKSVRQGNLQQSYELNQRRLSFKPGLDVRGMRAEEAVGKVAAFIDEAVMVGAFEVKILHGKGNGILRHVVRQYLQTVDVVTSVRDEHVDFGGAGITVVELG